MEAVGLETKVLGLGLGAELTAGFVAGAVCGLGLGFDAAVDLVAGALAAAAGLAPADGSLALFGAREVRGAGFTSPFAAGFLAAAEVRCAGFTSPLTRGFLSAEADGFVAETLGFVAAVEDDFAAAVGVVFAEDGFAVDVLGVGGFDVAAGAESFLAPNK